MQRPDSTIITSMAARLIVNADDFGLTAGINRGIEELHRNGALTSATLMANGPAFQDAVQVAKRNPTLGVGCHLVFVDGEPVSHPESIPTLLGADGKTFRPSLLDFAQALLRRTIRPLELAREAQAQIQTLQRAGIDVTHVDSHKHTHLFPEVFRSVLWAANRCSVHAFRYPFEPRWSRRLATHRSLVRRGAQRSLHCFEANFRTLAHLDADEVTTQGTLGIAATGTLDAQTLAAMLDRMQHQPDAIFELCCHPGFCDSDLARFNTKLLRSRDVEREVLTSVFQSKGAETRFDLIHYGNLGIPGLQRATRQFIPADGYEKVL